LDCRQVEVQKAMLALNGAQLAGQTLNVCLAEKPWDSDEVFKIIRSTLVTQFEVEMRRKTVGLPSLYFPPNTVRIQASSSLPPLSPRDDPRAVQTPPADADPASPRQRYVAPGGGAGSLSPRGGGKGGRGKGKGNGQTGSGGGRGKGSGKGNAADSGMGKCYACQALNKDPFHDFRTCAVSQEQKRKRLQSEGTAPPSGPARSPASA
jgi:hypothetical protein